jgi:hypothetical protein
MKIQDFIIGLMAFITFSLVILSLVFDMYSADGFDIDLDADNYTYVLSTLQNDAQTAQDDARTANTELWDNTAGQPSADIVSGSISEGDMMRSSLTAITGINSYVTVFTTMIRATFQSVGVNTDSSPLFWFFTSAIIVIVGMILITSMLRNLI